MAKPTALPVWNTDATNRSTPSGGLQASGYATNAIPTSGNFNWLFNLVYQWCLWISNRTVPVSLKPHYDEGTGSYVMVWTADPQSYLSISSHAVVLDITQSLLDGDRLTSIGWIMSGDGTADLTATVWLYPNDGSSRTSLGTVTITNESGTRATKTLDITDTTINQTSTGGKVFVYLDVTNGDIAIYNMWAVVGMPP